MSFLQPALLFALPLALLPVLVHLLNKRRHRTIKWAAMMFLVKATREDRGRRRLRHFLILACRVLAVAALVFLLSRPLAGGWLAWTGGNRPEAIVLILDRSPSMEARPSTESLSKRELAVERWQSAISDFASGTRLVLIDSAIGEPIELVGAEALADLPQTSPSDRAADLPALFERALEYLETNRPGRSEIWIASDLQASNWLAADGRWGAARRAYAELGQDMPVRVLALTGEPGGSHSLRLSGIHRDGPDLFLDLEIRRSADAPERLPLELTLDGESVTVEEVAVGQSVLEVRRRIDLGEREGGGYGRLSLPADLTPADNTVWFAYGEAAPRLTSVVSESPARPVLELLGAPPGLDTRRVEVFSSTEAHRIPWDETHLVVWQAPLNEPALADALREHVESGGSLLVLPPDEDTEPGALPLLGMGWAAVEAAPLEETFPIASWDGSSGVLANFRDGRPMALDRLQIIRRRLVDGEGTALARYADGSPAVVRLREGLGEAVFLTSLPDRRWSDLGRYNDLLPIAERLLDGASRYRGDALNLEARQAGAGANSWAAVVSDHDTPRADLHAGIYRDGARVVAVNPDAAEYDPLLLEREETEAIFEGMNMRLFEERVVREQNLATEIWRTFALAVVLFLLIEALLSLPPRRRTTTTGGSLNPSSAAS